MHYLEASAESVHAARCCARSVCAEHGVDCDRAEDVVLVASELVGNAVRYGAPPLAYDVEIDGPDVLVVVQDGDDTPPGDGSASPTSAEGGRGLFIVSQLAREWGWMRCRGGKQVWARI